MDQTDQKPKEGRETYTSGLGITMFKGNSEKQGLDYSRNTCKASSQYLVRMAGTGNPLSLHKFQ